jgi:ComF family protein
MKSMFRKISAKGLHCLHDLADLCFPPSCLACGVALPQSAILFCPDCLRRITFIREPYCSCCGTVFAAGTSHLCGRCLRQGWHFDRARAVLVYNETAARAILGLKFGGRKAALATFGRLKEQSRAIRDLVVPDAIIPVPLHGNRLRRRGFNQSLLLARAFFPDQRRRINKTALTRRRDTVSQTGLDGAARRSNMRDAFVVSRPEAVRGQNLLLVDDVFTTGTTVNECARVLKQAGAAQVEVLTLARVERNR